MIYSYPLKYWFTALMIILNAIYVLYLYIRYLIMPLYDQWLYEQELAEWEDPR